VPISELDAMTWGKTMENLIKNSAPAPMVISDIAQIHPLEPQARRITSSEWKREGTELFGEDIMKWRFVCPSCGYVQTPEQFRQYKDKGAVPDDAHFNCIGRYMDDPDTEDRTFKQHGGPCNYSSGGLFRLNPIIVLDEGQEISCFDFDRSKLFTADSKIGETVHWFYDNGQIGHGKIVGWHDYDNRDERNAAVQKLDGFYYRLRPPNLETRLAPCDKCETKTAT
jgi:hypothetical protein